MNDAAETPETQAKKVVVTEEPFRRIGGRRFFMTMGCGMMCTLLVWFAKIDGNIFRDIIVATVAVYIGGNTIQKIKAMAGETTNAG